MYSIGAGGKTPGRPHAQAILQRRRVMVFSLGLRNLHECHSAAQGMEADLQWYADNRQEPPGDLLHEAVSRVVENTAWRRCRALLPDPGELQWRPCGLFIDCRCFWETKDTLKHAADWGHCGVHPCNVVGHLERVGVLGWIDTMGAQPAHPAASSKHTTSKTHSPASTTSSCHQPHCHPPSAAKTPPMEQSAQPRAA